MTLSALHVKLHDEQKWDTSKGLWTSNNKFKTNQTKKQKSSGNMFPARAPARAGGPGRGSSLENYEISFLEVVYRGARL